MQYDHSQSLCLLSCIVSTHAEQVWKHSADKGQCQRPSRNGQATCTSRCSGQLPEKGEIIITPYEFGEKTFELRIVHIETLIAIIQHACEV